METRFAKYKFLYRNCSEEHRRRKRSLYLTCSKAKGQAGGRDKHRRPQIIPHHACLNDTAGVVIYQLYDSIQNEKIEANTVKQIGVCHDGVIIHKQRLLQSLRSWPDHLDIKSRSVFPAFRSSSCESWCLHASVGSAIILKIKFSDSVRMGIDDLPVTLSHQEIKAPNPTRVVSWINVHLTARR